MCYMNMFTQAFRSYQMQETVCYKDLVILLMENNSLPSANQVTTFILLDVLHVFGHIGPHPLEALFAMS